MNGTIRTVRITPTRQKWQAEGEGSCRDGPRCCQIGLGRGRGYGWWSGYCHYGRGTSTTVGAQPRQSGSTNSRGPGRVGARMSGSGSGQPRHFIPDPDAPAPRRARPDRDPDCLSTPTVVAVPRPWWQCPDRNGCTPTTPRNPDPDPDPQVSHFATSRRGFRTPLLCRDGLPPADAVPRFSDVVH